MSPERKKKPSFQGFSPEFKLLGEERFRAICKNCGLRNQDIRTVDEIFSGWEWIDRDRIDVFFTLLADKVRGNVRAGEIVDAIRDISVAYAGEKLKVAMQQGKQPKLFDF